MKIQRIPNRFLRVNSGLLLSGLFLCLAGCSTTPHERPSPRPAPLARERHLPLLNELGMDYDRSRIATTLAPTRRAGVDVRIAIHELGPGDRDRLFILVHGVLATHQTWRYVAGHLARDCDVWLVDLPGCGESDKPKPATLGEPEGYGPDALADRLLQAVSWRLAKCRTDVPQRRIVLAGHSLGGTLLIRALGDPALRQRHAAFLAAVQSLVLLAPCDAGLHAEIDIFRRIIDLKGWQAEVGQCLGILRRSTRRSVREGMQTAGRGTLEQARNLEEILSAGPSRRALQAMLRQAVPWKEASRRPDWQRIESRRRAYEHIELPCLIVWGDRDEMLPTSMGHFLRDAIPGAHLITLTGCSHSIPTEHPTQVATLFRKWLNQEPLEFTLARPLKRRADVE